MEGDWRPAATWREAPVDGGEWRVTLQQESRQRIVNKIMETLKRLLPYSGQEGLQELKKKAVEFEEKIYNVATSLSDYLRKLSLKMLQMENKSQYHIANFLPPSSTDTGYKPPDRGASPSIQPQGQSCPISLPANQPQKPQFLYQNMQNTKTSTGAQTSASLLSSLPPVSGTNQTSITVSGQNSNTMSNAAQNPVGSTSMTEGVPSNMFGNAQQQQQLMQFQQQLTQLQLQLVQFQQQLLMQSQLQQQLQTQQIMQRTPLQPATQSSMQTSSASMMWATVSSLPQNQLSTFQLPLQQQQQHQQPQRLLGQQSNHQNLQQQSSLYGMHHQQLGYQSNFSGLQQPSQQQPVLGTQSGNSSMQNNVSAPQDPKAQAGHANEGDCQEEVYQKHIQIDDDVYEVKPDISSLPNVGDVGPNVGQAPGEYLAIDTTGVSTPDGVHGNAALATGKPTVTEQQSLDGSQVNALEQ